MQNFRLFDRLSRDLKRRLYLMIGRAVLKVIDDSTPLQIVQVEALRGETIDGAEKFGMYGLTSHPLPGADALVLAVGGMRQHSVVMVDDRRHRVKVLEEGEVAIYTHQDESGNMHRIVLKDARKVEIHGGDVEVEASGNVTVNADGPVRVNAGGAITLNSSGDALVVQ